MTTLDELRRANLKEQRDNQSRTPVSTGTATIDREPPVTRSYSPPARPLPSRTDNYETAQNLIDGPRTEEFKLPIVEPPFTLPEPHNLLPVSPAVSHIEQPPAVPSEMLAPPLTERDTNQRVADAAAQSVEANPVGTADQIDVTMEAQAASSDAIVTEVLAALQRKRYFSAGVRATVDMPPDLFFRIKKYCHNNNNPTMRQLLLEVMQAFLNQQGY